MKKIDSPPISLEFQEMAPHWAALESVSLRRTQSGTWNVIGRLRNISKESMNDTWVLIQLFNDLEEFLTFEEVPIPINPLPPGDASPFKVVFEGYLPIKRISVAFKNASGSPIPAVDRRKKREWVEVEIRDEGQGKPEFAAITESPMKILIEKDSDLQIENFRSFETEAPLTEGESPQREKEGGEKFFEEPLLLREENGNLIEERLVKLSEHELSQSFP